MKRMIVGVIASVVLLLALIGGILLLSMEKEDDEPETTENFQDTIQYIIGNALEMTLNSSYITSGNVISHSEHEYVDTFLETLTPDAKVEVLVKKGITVEKGEILYLIDGVPIKSRGNGHILVLEQDDYQLTLSMLNYDKLYVKVQLPISLYDMIAYDTPVSIRVVDEKQEEPYVGVIDRIGYENNGGMFDVRIKFPGEYIMPGSEVEISFALGSVGPALFVNSTFMENIGGTWYVASFKGHLSGGKQPVIEDMLDQITKTPVQVGNVYMVHDGGAVFTYYEILSGLVDGEWILATEPSSFQ